jgi:methylmalonyl-CoA mutase
LNKGNGTKAEEAMQALQKAAVQNQNIFDKLMEAAKYCSLGQITTSLFEVGGQYRRNM